MSLEARRVLFRSAAAPREPLCRAEALRSLRSLRENRLRETRHSCDFTEVFVYICVCASASPREITSAPEPRRKLCEHCVLCVRCLLRSPAVPPPPRAGARTARHEEPAPPLRPKSHAEFAEYAEPLRPLGAMVSHGWGRCSTGAVVPRRGSAISACKTTPRETSRAPSRRALASAWGRGCAL